MSVRGREYSADVRPRWFGGPKGPTVSWLVPSRYISFGFLSDRRDHAHKTAHLVTMLVSRFMFECFLGFTAKQRPMSYPWEPPPVRILVSNWSRNKVNSSKLRDPSPLVSALAIGELLVLNAEEALLEAELADDETLPLSLLETASGEDPCIPMRESAWTSMDQSSSRLSVPSPFVSAF